MQCKHDPPPYTPLASPVYHDTYLNKPAWKKIRGGVERVVIVVTKDGGKIREAVGRSGAAEKIRIEYLVDPSENARQFHAKSVLRARLVRLVRLVRAY